MNMKTLLVDHTCMLLRDTLFSESTVFFSLLQMGHDTHYQKQERKRIHLGLAQGREMHLYLMWEHILSVANHV